MKKRTKQLSHSPTYPGSTSTLLDRSIGMVRQLLSQASGSFKELALSLTLSTKLPGSLTRKLVRRLPSRSMFLTKTTKSLITINITKRMEVLSARQSHTLRPTQFRNKSATSLMTSSTMVSNWLLGSFQHTSIIELVVLRLNGTTNSTPMKLDTRYIHPAPQILL
jgi:hypothetical protein